MPANISTALSGSLAETFRLLGQPIRIQVLLVIAREQACVCHIEAVLGIRQAVISQHLMVMREAGLVRGFREGRNIFYRLSDPALLDLIFQAAALVGLPPSDLDRLGQKPVAGCPCPYCNPGQDPNLSCRSLRSG